MSEHTLDSSIGHLHGYFSPDLDPVLSIEPGDTVVFETVDSGWGQILQPDPYSRPVKVQGRDRDAHPGHALTGPIFVEGAKAGDILEVHIEEIAPGSWGWSSGGGYPSYWNELLGTVSGSECVWRWAIDPNTRIARNQHGRELPIRPFMGILGMPRADPAIQSTQPPRRTGGNLDCKELRPGGVLELPVEVDGALFSVGDGHALQGDGEVAGTALECPMERVRLRLEVKPATPLPMPRARTSEALITFGLNEDLDRASVLAVEGMLDWMEALEGMSRNEALALCSLVADLRVTQVVNGVRGVHACVPRDLREGEWRGDSR